MNRRAKTTPTRLPSPAVLNHVPVQCFSRHQSCRSCSRADGTTEPARGPISEPIGYHRMMILLSGAK